MDAAEVVARAFDAYQRRDLDALIDMADPALEIRSLITEAERTTYHGHDGLRDWFGAIFEVFPDWKTRIVSTRDLGDGALVVDFDATGTAAGSQVPIHQDFWQSVRVRDGKVVWLGFHRTEADALETLSADPD